MATEEPEYQCTLDAPSLAVATKELNEVPKDRLSSVNTFRQWILDQKHIKCPTDTKYLLRYLRCAKFSQLRAREILTGFLTMKTAIPEWYDGIDTRDTAFLAILKQGYALPLGFDPKGRYVFLFRVGIIETNDKNYRMNDIWHACFAVIMNALNDERAVVNGVCWLMDFTGFEMKHMTYWGVDSIKKSTKVWQNNFPARMKGFHYYNPGAIFESLMALVTPLLTKKFRDRINIHGSNLEKVYKHFPKAMMPAEYLPDDYDGPCAGTSQQIIDKLIKELTSDEVRDRLLHETSAEWKIDLANKPDDIPSQSFRKLNVD